MRQALPGGLHEPAEEKADALKVRKANVDEQTEPAIRFRVSGILMLVVFKGGKASRCCSPSLAVPDFCGFA